MVRKCFYSFHYAPDNARASQVRNIGAIEGNRPAPDNDWEKVKKGGDDAIKKWIAEQMKGRTCCIVLVGSATANRKWINHEIVKAWDNRLGVVGIHIHGLKNFDGETSTQGNNPFDYIGFGNTGKKLSSIVKCYNPIGATSQDKYGWISKHLANAVEEAVNIRGKH
ncbi:TIR-like PF08937 domain protein [Bradyrhizobium sp. CCBAU 51745]|uniref:TIR domain-containing protein n=1 Tax=Bradyrhizobium sp. CCBAU 51745 TaxID=1325099 RepID=UPI0023069CE0|nr:TIR domain-containing protein [Bradyrhizobium sp. CCBAU 51745]MDA9441496.1 TIR-like PF08937 domain protein [Bradyrhizobium sp. CCBAU 51745]